METLRLFVEKKDRNTYSKINDLIGEYIRAMDTMEYRKMRSKEGWDVELTAPADVLARLMCIIDYETPIEDIYINDNPTGITDGIDILVAKAGIGA